MELTTLEIEDLKHMVKQGGWKVMQKLFKQHKIELGEELLSMDVTKEENQLSIKESQMYLMAFNNVINLPDRYINEIIDTEL